MAHLPVNHHLRPLYRTLAGLAGAYILVFGIAGLVESAGTPLFGRQGTWVLGLRTNLAFSLLSIAVGVIVLGANLIGRNLDQYVNLAAAVTFLVAGLVMMTLLQTDANFLNFTMATCVVSFILGLVMLAAGLYGRVGSPEQQYAEEAYRHGGVDPMGHAWQDEQEQPHRPAEEAEPELHRFG
jgi:hypothetical protein